MSDLTTEILDDISDYNMSCIDAEINVTEAYIDAMLRDMRIQQECVESGIIMEGDIIPERDGENIIKYIFLFIPRLIINLLRKLKEWITGEHIPSEKELKEIQKKEHEEMIKKGKESLLKTAREKVVMVINEHRCSKYPTTTGMLIARDDGYVYMWNINRKNAEEAFTMFDLYFQKYEEVFSKLFSLKNMKVDDDLIEFEKSVAAIVNNGTGDVIVRSQIPLNIKDLKELMDSWEKGGDLNKTIKKIEERMSNLVKKYHEINNHRRWISDANFTLVQQQYSSIQRIYAIFAKLNTDFGQEIAAATMSFKEIIPTSKKVFDKYKDMSDEALGSYQDILKEKEFVS